MITKRFACHHHKTLIEIAHLNQIEKILVMFPRERSCHLHVTCVVDPQAATKHRKEWKRIIFYGYLSINLTVNCQICVFRYENAFGEYI